jgi:hypothetical protein
MQGLLPLLSSWDMQDPSPALFHSETEDFFRQSLHVATVAFFGKGAFAFALDRIVSRLEVVPRIAHAHFDTFRDISFGQSL